MKIHCGRLAKHVITIILCTVWVIFYAKLRENVIIISCERGVENN